MVYEVMCTYGFKFFRTFVSSPQLFLLKFSVIKYLMWSVYGKKIGDAWLSVQINKLIDSKEREIIYENLDCI